MLTVSHADNSHSIPHAHRSKAAQQRSAHKASPVLVDPHPRPRPNALPAYNLANTLSPATPFERAPKRKPFYHQSSSSAESLSLSPHRILPPCTKPKRKPPAPPTPSVASHTTTISTADTTSKDTLPTKLVFTPAQVYPILTSRLSTSFLAHKSVSSPLLFDLRTSPTVPVSPPPYSPPYQLPEHAPSPHPHAPSPYPNPHPHPHMNSDTEDDDESAMIYTSRLGSSSTFASSNSSNVYTRPGPSSSSSQSLRSRIFSLASSSTHASSSRLRDKPICTTPGVMCAGETETETDEPSRALPTARIIPPSLPLIPPSTLEQRLTPLLFEFARLLSIVPAVFGTLYNLYFLVWPPQAKHMGVGRLPPERVDYFISALWAILTGYQCLALATGLLTRWRLYYPPLSTLVRLLALQGICWPATHLTLTVLGHEVRPVVTWAVIGTTTCCSRSVQIWVTSNLWWERRGGGGGDEHANANGAVPAPVASSDSMAVLTSTTARPDPAPSIHKTPVHKQRQRQTYWKRWGGGGKWGGRRWDWREVGIKCALPAGVVYFVMAWAEQLRRELAVSASTGAVGGS